MDHPRHRRASSGLDVGGGAGDRPRSGDTAEQRVQELKDYLMTAPQVMDPERLRCLLDVYEEFAGESTLYIRA